MAVARGLIFVRHALPEVNPGSAPATWELGDRGREDCVLLAHHLARLALAPVVFASRERKAEQTAAVLALRLGLAVRLDDRLGEVERSPAWDDDYEASARRYLATGVREGWERPEAVCARFGAAVEDALASQPRGDVLIVNHGLAMTLYLADRANLVRGAFWGALSLPDAWRLDLASGVLSRCLPP